VCYKAGTIEELKERLRKVIADVEELLEWNVRTVEIVRLEEILGKGDLEWTGIDEV